MENNSNYFVKFKTTVWKSTDWLLEFYLDYKFKKKLFFSFRVEELALISFVNCVAFEKGCERFHDPNYPYYKYICLKHSKIDLEKKGIFTENLQHIWKYFRFWDILLNKGAKFSDFVKITF